MVDERVQELILDLLLKKISEDEFLRQFPTTRTEVGKLGLQMLQRAFAARDPIGVEFGLYMGHRFGFSKDYAEILEALAVQEWHERHEDVVDGLAILCSPTSVEPLFRAAIAVYAYREYDEAFSLGVKCIKALGAIQSKDAIVRLGNLAQSGNEILEAEAKEELELVANNGRQEVQALAKAVLLRSASNAP